MYSQLNSKIRAVRSVKLVVRIPDSMITLIARFSLGSDTCRGKRFSGKSGVDRKIRKMI